MHLLHPASRGLVTCLLCLELMFLVKEECYLQTTLSSCNPCHSIIHGSQLVSRLCLPEVPSATAACSGLAVKCTSCCLHTGGGVWSASSHSFRFCSCAGHAKPHLFQPHSRAIPTRQDCCNGHVQQCRLLWQGIVLCCCHCGWPDGRCTHGPSRCDHGMHTNPLLLCG